MNQTVPDKSFPWNYLLDTRKNQQASYIQLTQMTKSPVFQMTFMDVQTSHTYGTEEKIHYLFSSPINEYLRGNNGSTYYVTHR